MSIAASTKVSVIIVNYNSTTALNSLLESLKIIDTIIREIVIIDNCSSDISDVRFPRKLKTKIRLHIMQKNFGFSRAVNIGIGMSKSNIVLLLNPDTEIIDKSPILTLNKLIKSSKTVIAGGRIVDCNGNSYPTANSRATFMTGLFEFSNLKKLFPNNKYSRQFWIERTYVGNKEIYVNSLCGAYMFIKIVKENVEEYLFDQRYFLYLEDLDYGNNINKNGFRVMFDPKSCIKHIGGLSSNSKYKTVLKYWYKSRKLYFLKNLNIFSGVLLYLFFSAEEHLLYLYHYLKNEPAE